MSKVFGDPVKYEAADRIGTLTLNDAERRNPITGKAMVEGILAALAAAEADPEVSVLIVTGAGSAFSAGGDIKQMRDKVGDFAGPPLDIAEGYQTGIQRIPLALYNLNIPTIAAVNGAAIGAGCDLAMMCDLRIAATNAKFGEVFVNLGIIPGDAGSWFLIRRLGYQLAAELTFSGRIVEAKEALELGMVLEVVEPDALMKAARARAATIASKPPRTIRWAKRLLRHAERMDLPDFLSTASAFQALMHTTEDHSEAMNALIEKREGTFHGR